MKTKTVWLMGLCALAVLGGAGLYYKVPLIQSDIQARVDKALALENLKDVDAKVDGQNVTLSARTATPQAAAHLAQASAIISDIKTLKKPLPGGKWVNNVVTQVAVIKPAPAPVAAPQVAFAPPPAILADNSARDSHLAMVPPAVIAGEKATAIDASADTTPPVAGDQAVQASSVATQACEDQLKEALGGRELSYVTGTYDLTPDSQPVLDDVAKAVATCPAGVKVVVAGYSDNAGDASAKLLITKMRAQVAADGLVKRGVAADRLTVEGLGGAWPIADNSTAEGRAQNQRIVIRVTG